MRNLTPHPPIAAPVTPARLQGFALKRACDLRLGDVVVLSDWKGVSSETVTSLKLVGDDVEFNNVTTSLGNVFVVVKE